MDNWIPQPPTPSGLGDHDVPLLGNNLKGKRIALLVSGGIAAMKASLVARELRKYGAEVTAFVSEEALRYTTADTLAWSTNNSVIDKLTAKAEHLSDSRPFDAYLLAPATYNSINKFRFGIADGLITTTLASALGYLEQGITKIIIVPTMHGSMHNAILTESVNYLKSLGVHFIPPRDAYGKHNIPETDILAVEVCRLLSSSELKGLPVLVTGGPTPVPVDGIRRITTRFTGKLGILLATELYKAGADVLLIHGENGIKPPEFLNYRIAATYSDYKDLILQNLNEKKYRFGIFSAAVADYQPKEIFNGKIASGSQSVNIELVPTEKVIKLVRKKFPELKMITFKFEQHISHEDLTAIARNRLKEGYQAVIANRGEEQGQGDKQVAYLVTGDEPEQRLEGKQTIAEELVSYISKVLKK